MVMNVVYTKICIVYSSSTLIINFQMENKVKIFTTREKILLANLVKENCIIENKRTDAATIQEKKKAWVDICYIYITHSPMWKHEGRQNNFGSYGTI